MKAFLIDPIEQTITEQEYSGNIDEIYQLIDAPIFACATFNEHGDCAFVDDEGLLKDMPYFFQIEGYPQPLAGKGLVLGLDEATGESTTPQVNEEWLWRHVQFAGPATFGRWTPAYLHRENPPTPE